MKTSSIGSKILYFFSCLLDGKQFNVCLWPFVLCLCLFYSSFFHSFRVVLRWVHMYDDFFDVVQTLQYLPDFMSNVMTLVDSDMCINGDFDDNQEVIANRFSRYGINMVNAFYLLNDV